MIAVADIRCREDAVMQALEEKAGDGLRVASQDLVNRASQLWGQTLNKRQVSAILSGLKCTGKLIWTVDPNTNQHLWGLKTVRKEG